MEEIYSKKFKDFKKEYLEELLKKYSISDLHKLIKKDLKELRANLGIKLMSSQTLIYWTFRGWNEQEATNIIEDRRKKRKKPKYTYLSKSFWIDRGFSEEEAISKIRDIQKANNTKFNIKTDISFSDKKYFLPDKVIEYIIKEGLWDIKKIIESSNNQGKHVFYYKTYDNYKMPKEYMKELMEEMDDKMEQDCLDGIEENMDDLPEDAIENGNQNNSMANLKLNLGEE